MIYEIRNRHLLALDIIMALGTPVIALLLRVENWGEFSYYSGWLLVYMICSVGWKLAVFFPMRLYSHYWRYASVDELASISLTALISGITGVIVFFGILRPSGLIADNFPRSIPITDALLTLLCIGGVRFGIRFFSELSDRSNPHATRKRVLVVGAGAAGALMIKEMKGNPHLGLEPVAFLDDQPTKLGTRIKGIPIVGTLKDMASIVADYKIEEVIIAMPSASGKLIREVVKAAKEAGVPSKTVPGISELLDGSTKVSQIRDVQIEDLLRRGIVRTNTDEVARILKGARVMVTGAGGSIGSELCRQISKFNPDALILLGHGETSIFNIAAELRRHATLKFHPVIADVRDVERMNDVFSEHKPEVIFHAAAHKHVGLMESNAPEAITNNVLGTQVLVDLAEKFNVRRFVMISSDKAVNPTCTMGVTKRVAELVVHEVAERTKRPYVSVRFGNVLGSRGSVVPIFKQQIANGGPVTVTHPKANRYFMTIPEAVQLVLQAGALGECGEVFVLDMGEPIRIADLARDLIRLSGLEEGKDIDIVYTGLTKGEKLNEELFHGDEHVQRSAHEKILVSTNGFKENTRLRQEVGRLIHAAHNISVKNLQQILGQIVPEYQVTGQSLAEVQPRFPQQEELSVEKKPAVAPVTTAV